MICPDVGKNILEIGAGVGMVSVVMSMLAAKEIIATDGDALLLPLLEKNIRKNSKLGWTCLRAEWVPAYLYRK